MTPQRFAAIAAGIGLRPSKTATACRLHLVDGLSMREAGRRTGADVGAISRAVARLMQPRCPGCGRPFREEDPGEARP